VFRKGNSKREVEKEDLIPERKIKIMNIIYSGKGNAEEKILLFEM